ncbi:MAG TPA: hypothetical protein VII93_13030 [Anaerolineales bacterium]
MATPSKGQHYRLVLYTYVINYWWGTILGIGIVLFVLVAIIKWLPGFLPGYTPPQLASWVPSLTGVLGAFAVLIAIFLLAIRNAAYVQPYDTHLRLVTPFMRMNISYRRFKQASSAEMGRLFPPENFHGWKRDFLRPLSKLTAIVLELNGWPLPRWVLNLYLSPFFFPDKTVRIALLVPDWMRFSNEMESFRSAWLQKILKSGSTPQADLLASFSDNK